MKMSFDTSYIASVGSPEKYLRFVAEAGFSHVLWGHQWNTDFLYSKSEIREYRKMLKKFGLTLLDVHGSAGVEKSWAATEEYRRKAGVELVVNRMILFSELEGEGVLTMHTPWYNEYVNSDNDRKKVAVQVEAVKRSLAELIPYIEKYHVKIAIENNSADLFEQQEDYMRSFPAECVGITFDCGHANLYNRRGLYLIRNFKDRIEALHLHDNNSKGDQHQPPFYGNIDWEEMMRFIRSSSYGRSGRPLSFEVQMPHTPFYDKALKTDQPDEKVREFLADAYERCSKVAKIYESL